MNSEALLTKEILPLVEKPLWKRALFLWLWMAVVFFSYIAVFVGGNYPASQILFINQLIILFFYFLSWMLSPLMKTAHAIRREREALLPPKVRYEYSLIQQIVWFLFVMQHIYQWLGLSIGAYVYVMLHGFGISAELSMSLSLLFVAIIFCWAIKNRWGFLKSPKIISS